MTMARHEKAIGKKRLNAENQWRHVARLISDDKTGGRAASVILNILLNNGFSKEEALKYRIAEGPCTERQARAVERTFYGRHYSIDAYDELKAFIYSPDRYIRQVPWKPALIWTNATPVKEEKDTRTDAEKAAFEEFLKTF